jgi:hypothetical protein
MKTMKCYVFLRTCLWCLALLPFVLAGTAHAQTSQGQAQPQGQSQSQKIYSSQQLDQMLAPVALYPDALLSQIFMATTYPSDVAEAAAWSAANPKAQGDDAIKQINTKPWDPSVQSLVAFPQVLAQMMQHPDWVQNVGDAFLAQPDDVMASVQRLRTQAKAAGNLSSTSQQKVTEQAAPPGSSGSPTIIQIEPADPQVVYVPSYNPTVVYGTWPYPAYPPTYWPPPYGYYPGQALAAGLAFGAGIAITGALWGGFNWGHGDVNVNVNRYNSVNNVNNRMNGNGNQRWNHNADNRRGTPYRDQGSRQRYDQGRGGAQQREAYRGRNSQMDASRQQALQSFDRSTNNGSSTAARRGAGETGSQLNRPSGDNRMGQGGAGERGNAGAGNRGNAGAGNRQGGAGDFGGGNRQAGGGDFGGRQQGASARNNAFSGSQSPGSSRSQMNRGQTSQRSMSQSRGAGGGAGRQMSRPAPSRGGGGGGRRRIGV